MATKTKYERVSFRFFEADGTQRIVQTQHRDIKFRDKKTRHMALHRAIAEVFRMKGPFDVDHSTGEIFLYRVQGNAPSLAGKYSTAEISQSEYEDSGEQVARTNLFES
ncbi:hypothetical protein [Rothia terrae]|uniref:DUF3892 domain-containing protein n=1 Tax=Rothia terrae TaxID=396015 RepID=A0A7H2BGF2_9MICC|nr:hypothetical protein [Rothia terrae]QNV38748.1 hypothetical protein IDM49_05775 [Rothia terrae]